MSAQPRRKGKKGENELARLLSAELGVLVSRNLAQAREGGNDLLLPGWSLEVKRAARPRLAEWWQQTLQQAEQSGNRPALAYRIDRHDWRVVVRLADLADNYAGQPNHVTAELCIDGFTLLIRESLPSRPHESTPTPELR